MGIWAAALVEPTGPSFGAAIVGCFPSDDRAFCRLVASLIVRLRPGTPEELERALRRTHPVAEVRPRQLSDESHGMWYVYRDGAALARWATGSWWHAADVPQVRLDAAGLFTAANAAAQRVAGGGSSGLLGRSFRSIAIPGGLRGIQFMWRTLKESGRLDTVYTFAKASGERITVEVHAEVTEEGVIAFWRPIALASAP